MVVRASQRLNGRERENRCLCVSVCIIFERWMNIKQLNDVQFGIVFGSPQMFALKVVQEEQGKNVRTNRLLCQFLCVWICVLVSLSVFVCWLLI